MAFTPVQLAQAIATNQGNNLAAYSASLTALQAAIAGGSLAPATYLDALINTPPTFTEVQGGVGFQNSWVNFGATAGETAGFLKTLGSVVYLRGIIKSGAIGSSAFTLPVGYRPIGRRQFPANTSPNVYGLLEVNGLGQVIPQVGSNTYFFIDCSFVAEQ